MTAQARRQQLASTPDSTHSLRSTMEQELQDGYLEVEITGITLRRLATAYLLLVRNSFQQTMESFRSLRRPTPAHQLSR